MRTALAVLLLAAVVAGAFAYEHERDQRRDDVAGLEQQLRAVERNLSATRRQSSALSTRIRQTNRRQLKERVARTTLAARVRKSVFTVTASLDEGTAWVGWVKGNNTYLLTANHVVVFSVARHELKVRIHEGKRVWEGKIIKTDEGNDLALILVPHRVAPPLWQRPYYKPPLVGDELLLAGSPLGYEGSITSGVGGRGAAPALPTDAAAYPGISGGPAVDAEGQVVGVVSSGEDENLNFLVPINRACVRLRNCEATQPRP
jgi:S1-C subfamily serine protease